jgi:hypothetical protein
MTVTDQGIRLGTSAFWDAYSRKRSNRRDQRFNLQRRLANDSQSPCQRLYVNMFCLYLPEKPQPRRFTPGHLERFSGKAEPTVCRIGLSTC